MQDVQESCANGVLEATLVTMATLYNKLVILVQFCKRRSSPGILRKRQTKRGDGGPGRQTSPYRHRRYSPYLLRTTHLPTNYR